MAATANPRPSARVSLATPGDMTVMIPIVNAAFKIEMFIDGTRTDADRLTEMMQKGQFLLAEDDSGRVVACVYTETRDEHA